MDAIVFEDSPISTYLEGRGHEDESSHDSANSSPVSGEQPSFAPRGFARIRGALPSPLKIDAPLSPNATGGRGRSATIPGRQPPEDEQFLEQYRYLIVASHLLDDQISTAHHRRSGVRKTEPLAAFGSGPASNVPTYSVEGAAVAAFSPFILAAGYRGIISTSSVTPLKILLWFLFIVAASLIGIYAYSRWKYAKEVRQATIRNLSHLITSSHTADAAVTSALNFIQEVEIVSRGYDITTPLPPISRIEERWQQRRCLKLRRELATCIRELCQQYIEVHHALLPYAPEDVVEQYHDIYDISRRDFQEVGLLSPQTVPEDSESLKSLKAAFLKQVVSRKVVLCDLLAFSASREDHDPELKRWNVAIEEMRNLASTVSKISSRITTLLQAEQGPQVPQVTGGDESLAPSKVEPIVDTPTKSSAEPVHDENKAQLARLTSLSQSIRTLNAKMHLFKEQSNEATEARSPPEVASILTHQYDSVGTDIRSLLTEWERGKQLMTIQAGARQPGHKRMSSRFSRSPMSPTHSLGGSTAVESSPSDALRRLNGEDDSDRTRGTSPEQDASDEEVFEAMSIPKQRSTLTREERIAKMKEDRLKRALFQEKRDESTNMLRELETVIKHRPGRRQSIRNPTA